jgi:hypothetical protein
MGFLTPNSPIRFGLGLRRPDRGPAQCRDAIEEARRAERATDGLAADKRRK